MGAIPGECPHLGYLLLPSPLHWGPGQTHLLFSVCGPDDGWQEEVLVLRPPQGQASGRDQAGLELAEQRQVEGEVQSHPRKDWGPLPREVFFP